MLDGVQGRPRPKHEGAHRCTDAKKKTVCYEIMQEDWQGLPITEKNQDGWAALE